MKTYVAVTGVIFALLAVAHIWRIFGESASLARDPGFIALTLVAVLLAIWAVIVLRRKPGG